MRSSQNETIAKPKGVYSIDQILGTHDRQNNNTIGMFTTYLNFINFYLNLMSIEIRLEDYTRITYIIRLHHHYCSRLIVPPPVEPICLPTAIFLG